MSRERAAVSKASDVPRLRVAVSVDGAIEVWADAGEWLRSSEASDFSAWLEPVVRIFREHDEVARAVGLPVLTPERMADALVETARTLLVPTHLSREGGRWRFRGGRPPHDPLASEGGPS